MHTILTMTLSTVHRLCQIEVSTWGRDQAYSLLDIDCQLTELCVDGDGVAYYLYVEGGAERKREIQNLEARLARMEAQLLVATGIGVGSPPLMSLLEGEGKRK